MSALRALLDAAGFSAARAFAASAIAFVAPQANPCRGMLENNQSLSILQHWRASVRSNCSL
jgi:hypothetical protein